MKHCSKFCCGIWPFILVPLIILLLAIIFSWKIIENDVSKNAKQALAGQKIYWAVLNNLNNGRDIELYGEAPTKESKAEAVRTIAETRGVRTVQWLGTIAPIPAKVDIIKTGAKVAVRGSSGSSLTQELSAQIDSNQYESNNEFKDLEQMNELISFVIEAEDALALFIRNDQLTLQGQLSGLGRSRLYERRLKEIFTGDVINELNITLPEVAEADIISNIECQSLFNELAINESVLFEVGKANVLPESYELLDSFTFLSLKCPAANFEVIGHTDNSGDPQFNQRLSLARAQSVVDHIVASGVNMIRFQAIGRGDSQPVADNADEAGRAANRRVEFKVFEASNPVNGNK